MASFGSIGPYEAGRTVSWDEYCERLDQFFIANEVSGPAKHRAILSKCCRRRNLREVEIACGPSEAR